MAFHALRADLFAPAATALIFDLGVFALVMGATILMLVAIAHQSLRSRRREREEE